MEKQFKPQLVFHKPNRHGLDKKEEHLYDDGYGTAVAVEMQQQKLDNLQPGSEINILFKYDIIDISEGGIIEYKSKEQVEAELSKEIITGNGAIEKPKIINPDRNGCIYRHIGFFQGSPFNSYKSTSHAYSEFIYSKLPNIPDDKGSTGSGDTIVHKISSGDLCKDPNPPSFTNTPYVYVKIRYTDNASPANKVESLPCQYPTEIQLHSADRPVDTDMVGVEIADDVRYAGLRSRLANLRSKIANPTVPMTAELTTNEKFKFNIESPSNGSLYLKEGNEDFKGVVKLWLICVAKDLRPLFFSKLSKIDIVSSDEDVTVDTVEMKVNSIFMDNVVNLTGIKVTSKTFKDNLKLIVTCTLDGEEEQVTSEISLPCTKEYPFKEYSNTSLITSLDYSTVSNLARFTEQVPESAYSVNWVLSTTRDSVREILWSYSSTEDLTSLGKIPFSNIEENVDLTLLKEKFLLEDIMPTQEELNVNPNKFLGIPLLSPKFFSFFTVNDSIDNLNLKLDVEWFDREGNKLGHVGKNLNQNRLKELASTFYTKTYRDASRTDLYSTKIYKLPYLTLDNVGNEVVNLNNNAPVQYRLVKPSASVLSYNAPLHSKYRVVESKLLETNNIADLITGNLVRFSNNITIFESIDSLANMIHSLSFKLNENNVLVRRPIELVFNNFTSSYTAKVFNSFDLTEEQVKTMLKENLFSNVSTDIPLNRRLAINVYPGINQPSYPIFTETLTVLLEEELNSLKTSLSYKGPDGYLNKEIDLSCTDYLKFTGNTSNYVRVGECFNYSDRGIKDTPEVKAKDYLPNYLNLIKSNFAYYGIIPFWACTDNGLSKYRGEFKPLLKGYKKGEEVFHPNNQDLYLCIKDRKGYEGRSAKNPTNHNYPENNYAYSVLEEPEYFIKVANGSEIINSDTEEYRRYYKSSLPTYLALIDYFNLNLEEDKVILYNPFNTLGYTKDMYLKDYKADMEANKDKVSFTKEELTKDLEVIHANQDAKYGAWFKLKNLNTHNYFYLSTRPVLWVKDKETIVKSGLSHPRSNIIRVGTKYYYVRLMTDIFYPEDDCCLDNHVLSTIPNIAIDFTSFNNPSAMNLKESLLGPTVRNILWLAGAESSTTNRNVSNIAFEGYEWLGDKVISINILSAKKDVNYFSRRGSLLYYASPYTFYLADSKHSKRVLDNDTGVVVKNITYNLQDSIPDFEYGSSEDLLGKNEILFGNPCRVMSFRSLPESRVVLGIDNIDTKCETATLTGYENDISKFNEGGTVVFYSKNIRNTKVFSLDKPYPVEEYYPVHIVLESVLEKDLPIYNVRQHIKDMIPNGLFPIYSDTGVFLPKSDIINPTEFWFSSKALAECNVVDDVIQAKVSYSTDDFKPNRFDYYRWELLGRVISGKDIFINNSFTNNILYPQLEKIISSRDVNTDMVRSKEFITYPDVDIVVHNAKLYIVIENSPFNNDILDFISYYRTKGIDSRSKEVSRVKLGVNILDITKPNETIKKELKLWKK